MPDRRRVARSGHRRQRGDASPSHAAHPAQLRPPA